MKTKAQIQRDIADGFKTGTPGAYDVTAELGATVDGVTECVIRFVTERGDEGAFRGVVYLTPEEQAAAAA